MTREFPIVYTMLPVHCMIVSVYAYLRLARGRFPSFFPPLSFSRSCFDMFYMRNYLCLMVIRILDFMFNILKTSKFVFFYVRRILPILLNKPGLRTHMFTGPPFGYCYTFNQHNNEYIIFMYKCLYHFISFILAYVQSRYT